MISIRKRILSFVFSALVCAGTMAPFNTAHADDAYVDYGTPVTSAGGDAHKGVYNYIVYDYVYCVTVTWGSMIFERAATYEASDRTYTFDTDSSWKPESDDANTIKVLNKSNAPVYASCSAESTNSSVSFICENAYRYVDAVRSVKVGTTTTNQTIGTFYTAPGATCAYLNKENSNPRTSLLDDPVTGILYTTMKNNITDPDYTEDMYESIHAAPASGTLTVYYYINEMQTLFKVNADTGDTPAADTGISKTPTAVGNVTVTINKAVC